MNLSLFMYLHFYDPNRPTTSSECVSMMSRYQQHAKVCRSNTHTHAHAYTHTPWLRSYTIMKIHGCENKNGETSRTPRRWRRSRNREGRLVLSTIGSLLGKGILVIVSNN